MLLPGNMHRTFVGSFQRLQTVFNHTNLWGWKESCAYWKILCVYWTRSSISKRMDVKLQSVDSAAYIYSMWITFWFQVLSTIWWWLQDAWSFCSLWNINLYNVYQQVVLVRWWLFPFYEYLINNTLAHAAKSFCYILIFFLIRSLWDLSMYKFTYLKYFQ